MSDVVNPQITKAIPQRNVKTLDPEPAILPADLYAATERTLADVGANAMAAQRESWATQQAAVTQGAALMLGTDAGVSAARTARRGRSS